MGLPRFLQDKFDAEWASYNRNTSLLVLQALCAGADYSPQTFNILNAPSKPNHRHVIKCLVRGRFKWLKQKKFNQKQTDLLTRVKGQMYLGIIESQPLRMARPEFRDVAVPRYFLPKLEQWNKERQSCDERQIDLLKRITDLQCKVYLSRNFPLTLRTIIFERDRYQCQQCGRSRDKLFSLDLHLEVDHIVSWEDGGKTTYSNGQTLCNQCNIAKHHTKSYLSAKAAIQKRQ